MISHTSFQIVVSALTRAFLYFVLMSPITLLKISIYSGFFFVSTEIPTTWNVDIIHRKSAYRDIQEKQVSFTYFCCQTDLLACWELPTGLEHPSGKLVSEHYDVSLSLCMICLSYTHIQTHRDPSLDLLPLSSQIHTWTHRLYLVPTYSLGGPRFTARYT